MTFLVKNCKNSKLIDKKEISVFLAYYDNQTHSFSQLVETF